MFRSATSGLIEALVVLRTSSRLHFIEKRAVCQNSFLRRGQENSVLCILFRSSMNFSIHLPRLLEICSKFCWFVCIVVGEEDCMIFFFTFSFFCHQLSFCNGIWISCVCPLFTCRVCRTPFVSHPFFVWHLSASGLHEYHLILCLHFYR